MSQIKPGTIGYVHTHRQSYLSHKYIGPVYVTGVHEGIITVTASPDGEAPAHRFRERDRRHTEAKSQHLILEGDEDFEKARKWRNYDALLADTDTVVRCWRYDQANPGLALQASEALRILASTPAPEGY